MAQKELPYNTHAFEILINRHQGKIFSVSMAILKDYHFAEDATQNAMLRIFHYLKTFKNESSFFTWAYRIAYNESLQIINKNKKLSLVEEESLLYRPNSNLDRELEVEQIMDTLKADEQEILYLKYTMEFKDEDIANILELELSAFKMRLKRLKDKIHNKYL